MRPSPISTRTGAGWFARRRCHRIDWRPGAVEAFAGGSVHRAGALVLALPLAVLAADPEQGGIAFAPELPRWRAALAMLEMGHAQRVILRLREPAWPDDLPPAAFVHSPDTPMPTCWLGAHPEHPQVTLWCGGVRAAALAELDRPALEQRAIASLAAFFHRPVEAVARLVIGAHAHVFARDPWARGAYPYARVGAQLDGAFEPQAGTLFVAGDFTEPDQLGTVGSAAKSGAAAAGALCNALGA